MLKRTWLLICMLAFGTIEATVTDADESTITNELARCQPRRPGSTGPTGPIGPTGPTGPTGPAAPALSPVNGTAINASIQFPIVTPTAFIFPFLSSSFFGTGITFDSTDNSFTVSESGRYQISFNAIGSFFLSATPAVPTNGTALWTVFVNNSFGVDIASTAYFPGGSPTTPDYSVFSTGGTIFIDLLVGDVLTVNILVSGPSFTSPPAPITLSIIEGTGITITKIQ